MDKIIYIFSSGELHRKDNTIVFNGTKGKKYIPVTNVNEIMIFGEVNVNKKFLDFISQNEITMHFFNYYGYYSGSFYPREHYNSGFMILNQAKYYLDKNSRLELAKLFVAGAYENIAKVLQYYNKRDNDLTKSISKIDELSKLIDNQNSVDELMAIEGNIRYEYYKAFKSIITNQDFRLKKRVKHPPDNEINALISFGNSMLYTIILSEIYKTHLDPRIGFLHTTNYRRFSLNLDVAEIFKPIIVDRVIFTVLNKKMLNKKSFEQKAQGLFMKEKGRKTFVQEFDKHLQTTITVKNISNKVSYRRLIRLELYKIEKHLMGEKNYSPYISKW